MTIEASADDEGRTAVAEFLKEARFDRSWIRWVNPQFADAVREEAAKYRFAHR
ncbi:MAG TPA: hypothetical protein VF618_18760 [Thermoanaerobaculia bacterium]